MEKTSDYDKCETCGEWGFMNKHTCPPVMYYKHEDYGDEWQEMRGRSYRDVALKFAEKYNEEDGEYCLMNSDTKVLISDGTTEKKFLVYAEPSVEYFEKEIIEKDKEKEDEN